MDNKQLFAKNLKAARTRIGLSQVKLAEMLSYTGKAISKWESGTALPPTEVLPKLAKLLDTDLNSLFDFREAPSYFLGIDGGGTKTKFMLTDKDGNVLNELTLGACNPTSVGINTSVAVFCDGIKQLCQDIPHGKVSVFIGSAGCGIEANKSIILEQLKKLNLSKIEVGSDAENIVSAALGRDDGIIAILGTGSIIYSSFMGQRRRVGGYGHFIGDTFSGSELGRACLEAVFSDLDKSGAHTALTEMVTSVKGSDISKILADMYSVGKTYMAELAHFVFEAAKSGDAVANSILDRNIEKLAAQLSSALSQLPKEHSYDIVLAGGITNFAEHFVSKIEQRIATGNLNSIKILDREPVVGAVLLAGAPEVKLVKGDNTYA